MISDDVSNLAKKDCVFSLKKWPKQFECFIDVVLFRAR